MRDVVIYSSSEIILSEFLKYHNNKKLNIIKFIFLSKGFKQEVLTKVSNLDSLEILNFILKGQLDDYLTQIDYDFLNFHRREEHIIFNMMNRIDIYKNQKYEDRKIIYYKLIGYWKVFFENHKFDLVFFETVPHEVVDYVFYLFCKFHKIETKILLPVFQFGRVMLSNSINYFDEDEIIKKVHKNLSKIEKVNFQDIYENHLDKSKRIRFEFPAQNSRVKITNLWVSKFKKFYRVGKTFISSSIPTYKLEITRLRRLDKRIYPLVHIINFIGFLSTKTYINLQKKFLQREYNLVSKSKFTLENNYVIFYLHYQPEATTSPLGGEFYDQELVISQISLSLPAGYILYVKEHFAQIDNVSGYSYLGRDIGFYQRISKISNVKLLRHDYNNQQLLANAKAVVAITGSIGWEAYVQGIPVIVLGEVWYKNLKCIKQIKNVMQIREELYKIAETDSQNNQNQRSIDLLKTSIINIHKNSFKIIIRENENFMTKEPWSEIENRKTMKKLISHLI
jgi:hypothetical protein